MNLEFVQWREPLWFWLMLLPILQLAVVWLVRRRQISGYADTALLPWARAPRDRVWRSAWWRVLWMALAWCAFVIALAGPRIPEKFLSVDPQRSTEVMLLVDLSRSMSANDLVPSRIELAKLKLAQLIQSSSNIRFGISVFAGHPHLLCPPTLDKQVLQTYLASLHTRMLPTEGSQLSDALAFTAANTSQTAAILLVTDGDLPEVTDLVGISNRSIFIFGFGTTSGAALPDPTSGWLTYDGQAVISQAKPGILKSLASHAKGRYIQATDTDADWQEMYRALITAFSANVKLQDTPPLIIWTELYHPFVLLGLLFLILTHAKLPKRWPIPRAHAINPLLLICILSLYFPIIVYAAPTSYREAYQALQQQDFNKAQKLFNTVSGYSARLGEGNAFYQLGNYPQAASQFTQAILLADTDAQRAVALFNLANSYYKLGDYYRASTIYRDTIHYQNDFPAAVINLEYALTLAQQKQTDNSAQPLAQRSGRGPRTALAPDNLPITQGRVTLDTAPQPDSLPPLSQANSEQPLTHNLDKANPATSRIESRDDPSWTYDITKIDPTILQSLQIQQDNSRFWQRLFEWEENFPVPVSSPHDIPGVKPW